MEEDDELVEAWRGGDERAGRRLVERHYPAVERFFFNKVGERAADLIQLSFLRVLEAKRRVHPGGNFLAYLLGIARNVLYEHYRHVRKDLDRLDFLSQSAMDLSPSPSSWMVGQQEARLLLEALKRIPLDHQIVLELYYWENMRSREVAEVLELAEGTTRSRIRRAKQLLEQQLAALATSPAQLRSTTANLEQWAAQLKQQVGSGPGAAGA
ncbi:MAG: sigma-70 family RNA polymerase sigma factor [Myxococcota bacterium]